MEKIITLILFISLISQSGYTQKEVGERSIKSCDDTLSSFPEIGTNFNKHQFDNWEYRLVNSSDILPSKCFVYEKVNFEIAISTNNIVEYIGTTDPTFKTKDSISINNTLNDLITRFEDHLYAEPGFGWIFTLPSGWKALIIESSGSYGNNKPAENSKISCLFKE